MQCHVKNKTTDMRLSSKNKYVMNLHDKQFTGSIPLLPYLQQPCFFCLFVCYVLFCSSCRSIITTSFS